MIFVYEQQREYVIFKNLASLLQQASNAFSSQVFYCKEKKSNLVERS